MSFGVISQLKKRKKNRAKKIKRKVPELSLVIFWDSPKHREVNKKIYWIYPLSTCLISNLWLVEWTPNFFILLNYCSSTESPSNLLLSLVCPPLGCWGQRRPTLMKKLCSQFPAGNREKIVLLLLIYWISSFLGKNYFLQQGGTTSGQKLLG